MKTKNITIVFSKLDFSDIQLERLSGLGKVNFIESTGVRYPKDTELLAVNPDVFGGVAKAKSRIPQLLDTLPNIKYLVLGSSDYGYLDLDYLRKRNIVVSYLPYADAASKAEHTIALVLACSRRILVNDRRVYRRKLPLEQGFEARGKSLGVIGSNQTAIRVIKLARALGMVVYTPERFDEEAVRKPINYLLCESDFITLHLPDDKQSKKFLNKENIRRLKTGSIVINIGNREWVDERAMNEALSTRKVDTYCFEAESMGRSPLKENEFAIMLKPFSSYTKETLEKNREAMVNNIESIARGIPYSKLEL